MFLEVRDVLGNLRQRENCSIKYHQSCVFWEVTDVQGVKFKPL